MMKLKGENLSIKDELNKTHVEIYVFKKDKEKKQDEINTLLLERDRYRRDFQQVQDSEINVKTELDKSLQNKKESDKTLKELRMQLMTTQNKIQNQDSEIIALETECIEHKNNIGRITEENSNLKKLLIEVINYYIVEKSRYKKYEN